MAQLLDNCQRKLVGGSEGPTGLSGLHQAILPLPEGQGVREPARLPGGGEGAGRLSRSCQFLGFPWDLMTLDAPPCPQHPSQKKSQLAVSSPRGPRNLAVLEAHLSLHRPRPRDTGWHRSRQWPQPSPHSSQPQPSEVTAVGETTGEVTWPAPGHAAQPGPAEASLREGPPGGALTPGGVSARRIMVLLETHKSSRSTCGTSTGLS